MQRAIVAHLESNMEMDLILVRTTGICLGLCFDFDFGCTILFLDLDFEAKN